MKFWTSSESMIDIEEPLRLAAKDVEFELNTIVGNNDYGSGVIEWDVIYIIMDSADPNYPEIHRYKKKKQSVEFRLNVDHAAFKQGSSLLQRKLLASAIVRSIAISEGMKIIDFDRQRLLSDVVSTFEKHYWM